MNQKLVWLLVLGLATVGFAGRAFCEDTVKLEYKFTPDELLRYEVSVVEHDDFIAGESRIHGILRVRTVRVLPNGDAELRIAYESGSYSGMGQVEEFEKKLQPITFTMSTTGVIKDMEKVLAGEKGKVTVSETTQEEYGRSTISRSTDAYELVLEALSNAFPKDEVKAGDTWTQRIESLEMGKALMAQCRLTDASVEEDGHTVARFTKHAAAEERDTSDGCDITGKLRLNAKTSFSTERGVITRHESDMDAQIFFGGGDASEALNMKAKTTMKLLPAREN